MRKYLATIHTRSDRHKKRFALLVSGGVTLLIFGIWSTVTFDSPERIATKGENEITPLESIKASVISALQILKSDADNVTKGLEVVHKEYAR